jgi:hypothetical protein
MKRIIISTVLGAIVASLLLGLPVLRGGRSGIVAKVHAQEGCSVASLNGVYGFYRAGFRTDPLTTSFVPVAAVGYATFDGAGNSTGSRQTIRRNGVNPTPGSDLFTGPLATGPYEVFPDCTGKFLLPDGTVFAHVVVVDRGREIFSLSLAPGQTTYGVFKKIGSQNTQ